MQVRYLERVKAVGSDVQPDIIEFAFVDTASFCSYVLAHGDGDCFIELVREAEGVNRVSAKLVMTALVDTHLASFHKPIFRGTFEGYEQKREHLSGVFQTTADKLRRAGLTVSEGVSPYEL